MKMIRIGDIATCGPHRIRMVHDWQVVFFNSNVLTGYGWRIVR